MSSSSLSLLSFTRYWFLIDHGYDSDILRSEENRAAAMWHYWQRFSVCFDVDRFGQPESFWWDREDGWLPVSLLPC
jgi:hypothetical protein